MDHLESLIPPMCRVHDLAARTGKILRITFGLREARLTIAPVTVMSGNTIHPSIHGPGWRGPLRSMAWRSTLQIAHTTAARLREPRLNTTPTRLTIAENFFSSVERLDNRRHRILTTTCGY